MALLQIVLLLLYALPSLRCLPITSAPILDTPDVIAWASQSSMENRIGQENESVRKIAKSIFITPERPVTQVCRSGYEMGADGKCYKAQNFNLDPLDILKSQVQTFLINDKVPTTVDYDEYDYDTYESTESSGPYHVPLSLDFGEELPNSNGNKNKLNEDIQNLPFLGDSTDKEEKYGTVGSTPSSVKSTKYEKVVPIDATANLHFNRWTDESLGNNEDDIPDVHEIKSTTPSNMGITNSDDSLFIFHHEMNTGSTTQKKVLVDTDNNPSHHVSTENDEFVISSTENSLNLLDRNQPSKIVSTTLIAGEKEAEGQTDVVNHRIEDNHIEPTTQGDDEKILEKELQSESLFQDNSSIGTAINVSDGTTEISENDVEVTTESLNYLNDLEMNTEISISKPISQPKIFNKSEKPIVVVPTVEQVQIVTPVQQSTTTNHHTTSYVQPNASTRQSLPSSTTKYNSEIQTAELLDVKDSMMNQKLKEVMKHELNEDAIETIDSNNRFVYTFDTPSNDPEPSTTNHPITPRSLLDQLRLINKFTNETRKNNRFRFPEPSSPVNIFSNFKGGTIKFPGPVQQRTIEPLFNRLIPEHIPKKSIEPSTVERPLFSWLPAGTSFDFSRKSNPTFMRFWNKMPLIRDPLISPNDSSEPTRSNSKSPTDNLYKDVPPSDSYKVTSKNYKHDNR